MAVQAAKIIGVLAFSKLAFVNIMYIINNNNNNNNNSAFMSPMLNNDYNCRCIIHVHVLLLCYYYYYIRTC